MTPRAIAESDLVALEAQRPELPEMHVDQRWRAHCWSCGWAGDERHFRERAAMDGRQHKCKGRRVQ